MTTTVEPSTEAAVARARALLHVAAEASAQLEESVQLLVAMRAWDLLGYENFSEMWERENGFKCPTYVRILATIDVASEGMNTVRNCTTSPPNGHRLSDVANLVGMGGKGTVSNQSAVSAILRQARAGVPAEHIRPSASSAPDIISRHARGVPRRMGASPDELVAENFGLPKRDADAIAEIARQANVPKAEIYRQAVAEYLMRHRESRASQS